MFNNTSRVLPYSSGLIAGVVLPHSEKILNFQDLDKKISKVKGHIQHLIAQLPQSNTHGGKASRSKKISLQNQISFASERLHLLEIAKAAIPDPTQEPSTIQKIAGWFSSIFFGTPQSGGSNKGSPVQIEKTGKFIIINLPQ